MGFYGSHAINKPDLTYKSEEEEQSFREINDFIGRYEKPILFHTPFTREISASAKMVDKLGKYMFRNENECAFALHVLNRRWEYLQSLS